MRPSAPRGPSARRTGTESPRRITPPTHGGDEPQQLAGGVQADREDDAGKIGPVRGAGERRQAHPEEQAERERDDRGEDRLDALGAEQHTPAEAPAVQDRQLESLSRERECTDAGKHGERDGADLEDDEQDRHREIGDPLPHDVEERAESGDQVDRAQTGPSSVLQAREDALESIRDVRRLLERDAREVEVRVPGVLGGQLQLSAWRGPSVSSD